MVEKKPVNKFNNQFDQESADTNIRDLLLANQANAANRTSREMNAIAIGVAIALDPFSSYLKTVTQKTIEVARQLGIDEEEIQQWLIAQLKLDCQRKRVIKRYIK